MPGIEKLPLEEALEDSPQVAVKLGYARTDANANASL